MMKKTVPLALLAASIVAIAACSGGGGGGGGGDDDDDDDDDAATPGVGEVRLTINAAPHPDQVALFRLKRQGGGAPPPIVCSQTTLDVTGQGVLTSAGLVATETYNRAELVLNLDGNAVLNIGTDHIYNYATDIIASSVSGTDLVFNHDDPAGTGWVVGAAGPADPPAQFSWVDGVGCPGE